jgi:hypothetical protein
LESFHFRRVGEKSDEQSCLSVQKKQQQNPKREDHVAGKACFGSVKGTTQWMNTSRIRTDQKKT